GLEDAEPPPERRRQQGGGRVPGGAEVVAVHPAALRQHEHAAHAAGATGLWSWLTTVDHKRIGILYGVSALVFFIIGGLGGLIIRLQLARPPAGGGGAETAPAR